MSLINLSEYLTVGMIAKGQNTVIRVKSIYTQQEYALKKIRRADFDKHLVDLQELLHLMNCSHAHIMKILGFTICQQKIDSYRNEYILCILMEILDKTLEKEIKDRSISQTFYSKAELLRITRDLISALHYMQHELKMAHRDVKPENLLLSNEGAIILSDFSESFLENEIKKASTTLVGSPYYMAPELREIYVQGEFGDRPEYNPWKADVYSTGMSVLDCGLLTIGEKKPKKEKLDAFQEKYGKEFRDFLELCLCEDPEKRPDFLELVKSQEFLCLEKEEDQGNVKEKQETLVLSEKQPPQNISPSLASEFLEIIESLKEELKEETLDCQEVLALFKEIQLLEQEQCSQREKLKEINKNQENIGNFDSFSVSTSDNNEKKPEESSFQQFQSGNTQ